MTLAEYLTDEGLKPSQFAERLGMPASTILRILSGARAPRLDTASRIVNGTGGRVTFPELGPAPAPAPDMREAASA